jgi:hypothetical protein
MPSPEKVHFFFFFLKERVFFLLFGERDATTRATKTIQQPKEARARKNKQQETCVPGRARD